MHLVLAPAKKRERERGTSINLAMDEVSWTQVSPDVPVPGDALIHILQLSINLDKRDGG